MKNLFYLICLVTMLVVSCQAPVSFEEEIGRFNYVLGTQTVGAKYKFTDETNLVETAIAIREMGSNLLKMSMSPRYWWENYDIPFDPEITSLKKLAQEESMKRVLKMDFTYYQIWIYEFSQYTQEPEGEKKDEYQITYIGGMSDEHAEASYREVYELACYLLETYSGTDKVMYLGNWEADWHLRWDYNRDKPADPGTIEGMIRWFNVRQQAIDDAKRDTPHHGIDMYHYIELNLSDLAVVGKDCVTNSVLPYINPDYVSFSAYTATNPPMTYDEMADMLKEHLDYIESKIQPKQGLPSGKRLFIGEYGWSEATYPPDVINERAKWVIRIGLEWGSPYILFWEMYNNELDPVTGENRGFWLINDRNEKMPLYHTHRQFYDEAREWLRTYANKHDRMPSQEEFMSAALTFKAIQ